MRALGVPKRGHRYYTHPVTLTVAVGSIDGEASKAMSAIASRLVTVKAPVRFKVVVTGTVLEAATVGQKRPFLARLRHPAMSVLRSLLGGKRT